MSSLLNRAGRYVAVIAALTLMAGRVAAQTPEGTVIQNTATVTYTDANSNAYAPVSGSVSVTVGFTAGVSVTANHPTPTPASPSTGNQLTFTVTNAGNGTDSVTVSQNISVAGVITVTGYEIGATSYANLAALNLALSRTVLAQGGTVTVEVNYDVAANQGGVNTVYTLTAASRRTPATTANGQSSITPAQTYAVATTPDGGQNLQRLPGTQLLVHLHRPEQRQRQRSVRSAGHQPGLGGHLDRVGQWCRRRQHPGHAGQPVPARPMPWCTTSPSVAAGSTDTLYLRARSVGQPATLDDGFADLTVVKPNLTITKQVFRDDGVTVVVGTVLPGEFLRYQVTVTNSGSHQRDQSCR